MYKNEKIIDWFLFLAIFFCIVRILTGCTGGQVHFENDLLGFAKNEDKNFTHGTKFSYNDEDSTSKTSYSLGQNIYTPDRKHNDAPKAELDRDRPYTGYLYSEYRHSDLTETGDINTFGIQVGCVGPCSLAKQTQQQIHRWRGINIPAWPREDTLKSEVTLSLELQKLRPIYETPHSRTSLYINGKFGNLVDSAAGGFESLLGYNIPTFSVDPIIFKLPNPTAPKANYLGYFFIKGENRFVAYNHVLDGSLYLDERHTVNSEADVRELDVGFTIGYGAFKFTYTYFLFSNEWTDEKPGGFSFGGIDFSW